MASKFRWGIVGTSAVARKFALGLRQSQQGEAALICSRSYAKAAEFARSLGIARSVAGIARALQDDAVDGLYIATPAVLHREHAVAALQASRPTLVEKPFASSLPDAQAIVEAARQTSTFCMEGMWTRFLPIMRDLRGALKRGAIGTPRSLVGSFGGAIIPNATASLFSASLGGGALAYQGVYALSLARDLFGPAELLSAAATLGETGVDEDCVVIVRHGNRILSTIRASWRVPLSSDLTIEGTEGTIHLHAPIFRPYRFTISPKRPSARDEGPASALENLRESGAAQYAQQRLDFLLRVLRGRKSHTVTRMYLGNGYHYEADEVVRCVRECLRESALMPLSQSLEIVAQIDRARALLRSDQQSS
jgi:predicted dehydrogenase